MECVGVIMVCYQYRLVVFAGCNWESSSLVCVIFLVRSTFLRNTRCLLTEWVGVIGLVLDLVLTGVPFPVLI